MRSEVAHPVIFLDIDGVMLPERAYYLLENIAGRCDQPAGG